jgi:NTP pyrophosphatase (non-canonical NTP hydrolase)
MLAGNLCSGTIGSTKNNRHFQWREDSADAEALAGELADVALYLLQLASIMGIDLEQAILDKLAFNQTREWSDP